MATIGTPTRRVTFPDGWGVDSADLDAISRYMTQRAWEVPGLGDLVAYDALEQAQYNTSVAWLSSGSGCARSSGVFCAGGAFLIKSTTLTSAITVGMIGIWDYQQYGPPAPSSDTLNRMAWCCINVDWTHAHDAASSGMTRYDLITVSLNRANVDATRSFKDASTGEMTSLSGAVAEASEFTITVTKGNESSGTPTIPAIPAGEHIVGVVKVGNTDLVNGGIWDLMIPLGKLKQAEVRPAELAGAGWSPASFGSAPIGITSTGASTVAIGLPPEIRGNRLARVLGFRLWHTLQSGDTVTLYQDPTAVSITRSLTSLFTAFNTTERDELIDLRSLPAAPADTLGPVWGHGDRVRGWLLGNTPATPDSHTSAFLKIVTAGAGSLIHGVTWYYING